MRLRLIDDHADATAQRELGPAEAKELRRQLWRVHNDAWVALFRDLDTHLHFVQCRSEAIEGQARVVVSKFTGRQYALDVTSTQLFREWWAFYPFEIIRYEALKELGDYHRRVHWRFDTEVLFVGTEQEMEWVARLTMNKGMAYDPRAGLFVPPRALKDVRPA